MRSSTPVNVLPARTGAVAEAISVPPSPRPPARPGVCYTSRWRETPNRRHANRGRRGLGPPPHHHLVHDAVFHRFLALRGSCRVRCRGGSPPSSCRCGTPGSRPAGRASRSMSLAWISMSVCCPCSPEISGWWISTRLLGSSVRLPLAPAASSTAAIDAAWPTQIGGDVGLDVLHGVVDRQAGGDRAAGRVDVEGDVLLGVLRLEEEHLGDDQVGDVVVDRRGRGR